MAPFWTGVEGVTGGTDGTSRTRGTGRKFLTGLNKEKMMDYIFTSQAFPKKFVNIIVEELKHPSRWSTIKTTIPGFVTFDDIFKWYTSGELLKIPRIGKKTVIQVFQIMKAESEFQMILLTEKIEKLEQQKRDLES